MKIYIYLILLLWPLTEIDGQIDTIVPSLADTLKKIEVDEVQVIKSFEVKLGEAKRIGLNPVPEKVIPKKNTYDYDVTIAPAIIIYEDPIIKPLAMNPDPIKEIDNFYAKLGYGNLKSPYGDISYFRHIPELYEFMISAHHYGVDNSSKVEDQKYNETEINLSGKYLLGENTLLSADISGNLDKRTLYGNYIFDETDPINRNLDLFEVNIGVATAETNYRGIDASFNLGVAYQDIHNASKIEELDIKPNGKVSMKINEHLSLGIQANAYITNLIKDSTSNYTTLEANPNISFNRGIFNISVGADILNDADSFSPFVDLDIGLRVGDNLQVYMGADQEIMRNNLATSMERNPYISTNSEYMKNSIVKRIYGGARGTVTNRINYDISASYEEIKDHYYYTYEGIYSPTFSLEYTDVKNIAIDANVHFNINESTQVGAILSHNFFDVTDLDDIYNIPSYRYEAFSKLGFLQDKLHIKGSLGLVDAISYFDYPNNVESNGNSLTDISAEIDYFITPNIGLWAKGNNLLDNKYEALQAYPTVGLNVLGGVLIKF